MGVSLLRDEVSLEGEYTRRFYDLKLIRGQSRSFALSWTGMHQIDESSPLYGETPESMSQSQTDIAVTITGLDETVSQTVHARHYYLAEEILWDKRFVDIISTKSDGRRMIDYTRFHDVIDILR
jgi:inward rectifier potassium channel